VQKYFIFNAHRGWDLVNTSFKSQPVLLVFIQKYFLKNNFTVKIIYRLKYFERNSILKYFSKILNMSVRALRILSFL